MSVAAGTVDDHAHDAHRHVVGVYERDDELIAAIVSFLAEALDGGGTAIVVATPEHRRALAAAVESAGYPLPSLTAAGRYQSLDARDTLARIMRDRHPDPEAFASACSDLIEPALATGRPVRVFGEMVGLLWDDGNVAGALDLESLWNRLATRHRFALFCAYALSSLETSELAATKGMCDRHSDVVPLPAPVPHEPSCKGDTHERLFMAAVSAPQDVRAFVRDIFDRWGESRLDGEAEIVASELATNAVRHARSPFTVELTRTPSAIRISVRDASSEKPVHVVQDRVDVGGRGIRLVAALSSAWGTDHEADGKTVWAEVPRASE